MADHLAFLDHHAEALRAFKEAQQRAFDEERERWRVDGSASIPSPPSGPALSSGAEVPARGVRVGCPIAGSVWSVPVSCGDRVALGQRVAVIEAMKMEVSVEAPVAGVVTHVAVTRGAEVSPGQPLLVIEADDRGHVDGRAGS